MMGRLFQIVCGRILPALVLLIAVFVGWMAQHEHPEGIFFAIVFPLLRGHCPPPLCGHGLMTGTPPVPEGMTASRRPSRELYANLPGGYKMPRNGLGMCCRHTAYDDVLVRRTVLWYLLLGGRHIDGAHLYLNHRSIGLGIRDAMELGITREEIFVTTKIFSRHFGYNSTKEVVSKFPEELGLDYVDLVLMHMPVQFPTMINTECRRKGLSEPDCRAETWRALTELRNRDDGIVRNVGVSNFATHHLEEFHALGAKDGKGGGGTLAPIAVNQIQYNPWAPDHAVETVRYCQEHGIAVTAYSSLGGVFQHSQAATVQTLTDMAARYEKSVAQLMLRWALQSQFTVIPGTGNPEHMKENLDVYTFELSNEDMDTINGLRSDESARKFFYMDPFK